MKTSSASILTVISLSLALCACDSGDNKDKDVGTAPKVPKNPKPVESGANPQPPESNQAPEKMNESASSDQAGSSVNGLERINSAIKMYSQRKSAELMGKMGPMAGGASGGDPNSAKQKYLDNARKKQSGGSSAGASSVGLTSLDQLVTAGLLKSIPEAPAGKKYVLDVKTQQVGLADK